MLPRKLDLPSRYYELLAWYQNSYANQLKSFGPSAALLHYIPAKGSGVGDYRRGTP